MQFSKILLTALSLAFAQTAVAAPNGNNQAAAGRYLAYLDQYRLEHPDLNTKQVASVDKMRNLANNLDQLNPESEAALKKEAIAAFGHDDGLALLNPGFKPAIEKRKTECDCADASAYCPEGWECKKGSGSCKKTWGCGFSGLYDCDGQCIS